MSDETFETVAVTVSESEIVAETETPEYDDVALWRSQLVELEYHARAALRAPERMREWMPDPRLGPVPAEVVPELQRVIGVYQDVIERLGRARAALAAELRASSRAAALVAPPTAVYLDVRG